MSSGESYYGPWIWSSEEGRHYAELKDCNHQVIDILWAKRPDDPEESRATSSATSAYHSRVDSAYNTYGPAAVAQYSSNSIRQSNESSQPLTGVYMTPAYTNSQSYQPPLVSTANYSTYLSDAERNRIGFAKEVKRPTFNRLPEEDKDEIDHNPRRYIQSGYRPQDAWNAETLDTRYRRVKRHQRATFFVPGRVFKMLWSEPAGEVSPGKTRGSTHFSTVRFGETVFSEIRRFIVIRNKGDFSSCIPIQTYKGQGATKPGLVMSDHGIVHTSDTAPNQIPGENLTKHPIKVIPNTAYNDRLEPESRVNYGKPYVVEHNVKLLEVGMVCPNHLYLIAIYFDQAVRGA